MGNPLSNKIWRLKSSADKRFRAGHPWVFSNELAATPKGILPGEAIELHDAGGKFLARGYGNPSSLIAFRALTRNPELLDPLSVDSLTHALLEAQKLRKLAGLEHASYRLCFGEADFIPGLIIDRYQLEDQKQVFSVQAHTAGIDRALPQVLEAVKNLAGSLWDKSAVILRNDIQVRTLEGIQPEDPVVKTALPGIDLRKAKILVLGATHGLLSFETDLIEGQKTGFFLDQATNIQLAIKKTEGLRPPLSGAPLQMLDICCYVGQWGAQLSKAFILNRISCEVTAADASTKALNFAKRNIEAQGASCHAHRMDVLEGLSQLPDQSFDLIVCDPPALIKNRKDIPAGTHAYLQLNTQVFRLIRPGGIIISCSCSGLLDEADFKKVLSKAAYRNRKKIRWIARGCQGPDHPMLMEFDEGHYLKCFIGRADCI